MIQDGSWLWYEAWALWFFASLSCSSNFLSRSVDTYLTLPGMPWWKFISFTVISFNVRYCTNNWTSDVTFLAAIQWIPYCSSTVYCLLWWCDCKKSASTELWDSWLQQFFLELPSCTGNLFTASTISWYIQDINSHVTKHWKQDLNVRKQNLVMINIAISIKLA